MKRTFHLKMLLALSRRTTFQALNKICVYPSIRIQEANGESLQSLSPNSFVKRFLFCYIGMNLKL